MLGELLTFTMYLKLQVREIEDKILRKANNFLFTTAPTLWVIKIFMGFEYKIHFMKRHFLLYKNVRLPVLALSVPPQIMQICDQPSQLLFPSFALKVR